VHKEPRVLALENGRVCFTGVLARKREAGWRAGDIVAVAPGARAEQARRAARRRKQRGSGPRAGGVGAARGLRQAQRLDARADVLQRLGGPEADCAAPDLRDLARFAALDRKQVDKVELRRANVDVELPLVGRARVDRAAERFKVVAAGELDLRVGDVEVQVFDEERRGGHLVCTSKPTRQSAYAFFNSCHAKKLHEASGLVARMPGLLDYYFFFFLI